MENDPFIDDFPSKTTFYRGFSMAMLNNQMVKFQVSDDFSSYNQRMATVPGPQLSTDGRTHQRCRDDVEGAVGENHRNTIGNPWENHGKMVV